MAIITAMPNQQIIDGFKGTLDFYLWKGIPCVRKWPVWRPRTPTPEEAANQHLFAYANSQYPLLSLEVKQQWTSMASGTGRTGKDLFVRAYLKGTNV